MKTQFLKFSLLSFLALTLLGCCDDCNYISVAVDEPYTDRGVNHDICNSKEAVIIPRSYYNTQTGEAELYIPVPKGHQLKKVKQTKNSVNFITLGNDFTNEFVLYKVELGGFRKEPQASITVELEIKFTGNDLCGISTSSEKKKKSEVTGLPN